MQSLLSPPEQTPKQVTVRVSSKLLSRVIFGVLVLASAVIGAFAGLLLVYSTDLPQVEELEHYRPSAITELYDDHDRDRKSVV